MSSLTFDSHIKTAKQRTIV